MAENQGRRENLSLLAQGSIWRELIELDLT